MAPDGLVTEGASLKGSGPPCSFVEENILKTPKPTKRAGHAGRVPCALPCRGRGVRHGQASAVVFSGFFLTTLSFRAAWACEVALSPRRSALSGALAVGIQARTESRPPSGCRVCGFPRKSRVFVLVLMCPCPLGRVSGEHGLSTRRDPDQPRAERRKVR